MHFLLLKSFSISPFFPFSVLLFFLYVSISLVTPLPSPKNPTPLIPSGAVPGGQKGSLGGRGGDGGGPSRSDSVKSMMMGASKAGRWQMAQGRTQSEDLKSGK